MIDLNLNVSIGNINKIPIKLQDFFVTIGMIDLNLNVSIGNINKIPIKLQDFSKKKKKTMEMGEDLAS